MGTDPTLSAVNGSVALDTFTDPLLVDPGPALLSAVIDAYRGAAPTLVDPDIDELRAAAADDEGPLERFSDLPTLTVLADDRVVDAVTERFVSASRLAALVESGCCRLRTGVEPQPAAVLAGRDAGCVLVEPGPPRARGDDTGVGSVIRIGSDPTLRERYAHLADASEERLLRTPSRHRAFDAFRDRCGEAVAAAVVRAIDARPDPSVDDAADARTRAYAVGVRHGALDHALRRACEDAGLGSRATFTRIKRELREADLLETEAVPQPVGRPRERLVARGALAVAEDPEAVVTAIRSELE
ncbi:transcriptional regulator TbsP domain-containing protein [Halorubrum sp. DTA46]|uniref:transcriptional regulator TbsP domain-containing protein n=1 Tax=Halorubrum sp. DTA46 TaxID=3402162 RepID=UPI003AAAABE3